MAIPALDSLVDEIQADVNDVKAVLATDAKVISWINEGYWKAARKVIEADLGYFLVYNSVTTVDSTSDYDLNAGFIAVKKVDVSYDGTTYYTARPISIDEDYPDRVYVATDPFYMFTTDASGTQQIRIRPTPDTGEGAADCLRIWEYRIPTQLTGTDNPQSPLYLAYDLLKSYAIAKLYRLRMADGDTGRGDRAMKDFTDGLEDLVQNLVPRHMGPEFIKTASDYDGYTQL